MHHHQHEWIRKMILLHQVPGCVGIEIGIQCHGERDVMSLCVEGLKTKNRGPNVTTKANPTQEPANTEHAATATTTTTKRRSGNMSHMRIVKYDAG